MGSGNGGPSGFGTSGSMHYGGVPYCQPDKKHSIDTSPAKVLKTTGGLPLDENRQPIRETSTEGRNISSSRKHVAA